MQTVTLHEQTNTMKIKVVEQVQTEKEMDVQLPYYCIHKGVFYFVISEEECLRVDPTPYYIQITKSNASLLKSHISAATPCTEQEFTDALSKANTSIAHSLIKSIPCQK